MSNTEAKFILEAYRANGRDAEDATFGGALAQARTDPTLGAWFARAQAHDAAMTAKLREIAPPAGLREAILAGARASWAPEPERSYRRVPWVFLSLAACIVVGLAVALFQPAVNRVRPTTPQLTAFAVDDTAHGKHGSTGPVVGALQVMMSQPTTHLGAGLPVDFAALHTTGCRTLSFAGHDVLELCFQRDGAWFHCYITQAADFPAMAKDTATDFEQQAGFGSASWSDGVHRFVLVSDAGLEAVKRLL